MTRRFLWLLAACCSLLLIRGPRPADACGGSDYGDLSALGPISYTVNEIGAPDPWAEWGNGRREELRFLYPFRLDQPVRTKSLWAFAHEWKDDLPAPSVSALEAALARGDDASAKAEAKHIVDALYTMPPVPAAHHSKVMQRAVEVIDGAAPSSAWEAHQKLRSDFAQSVPNGWAHEIRKKVLPATWTRLLAAHEAWLKKHPGHPLADQVRLDEVRIHYFAGRADAAWQLLLPLLKRRPARALAEMRYLLVQGMLPSDGVVASIQDVRLLSALVPRLAAKQRLPRARWSAWWKRSVAARAQKAPWAINFQERLLFAAAIQGGPLPPGLPLSGAAPTPLWGKLRGAALARAGALGPAEKQLARVASDPIQARLLAQVRLRRGRLQAAMIVQGLSADPRRYLLRVRATDATLKKLRSRSGDLGIDVRQEWGQRLVAKGRWRDAAKVIDKDDHNRADLWRRAAAIAAPSDDDAKLALARFLVTHRSSLFDGHRNGFYRGLSFRQRDQRLPVTERNAIASYLARASADWQALLLFTEWLEAHPRHADASAVLREADAAYNRLINRGGWDQYFWGKWTVSHPRVVALRRVGKAIRSRI